MKEDENQNQKQPLDNPILPETKDWWDELCKANNEVNHFPKGKNNED